MALIERLMGLEAPKIPVHAFYAANNQRIETAITRQDVIDMFALDAAAIAEYDALAALAPTGSSALAVAQKAMFIEEVHSVLILAEGRYPGYDTPALIRTKLGI